MSRKSKYTIAFEKQYPEGKSRSSATIAKHFNIKKSVLDEAFNRGIGAFKSNRSAVRKGVTSAEAWAKPREYKLVLNILKARKGGAIKRTRGSDADLIDKALK